MKRYLPVFILLLTCILWTAQVHAGTVTLNYAAAATAVDNGPQDGVFDSITTLDFGSVVNNGYTSLRTAVEFHLSAIPAYARINAARLNASISNFEGTRYFAVNGYPGNGAIALSDFSRNNALGAATLGVGTTAMSFDVTQFLSGLLGQGDTFAGFNFREEPANTENFLVMHMTMSGSPTLVVDFTPVIVVSIRIKPGSYPNSINPSSRGKISVAILSNEDFDAPSSMDNASLRFGRTGNEPSLAFCNKSSEDVNGDGLPDLVCHFTTQLTGFRPGDTQGILTGILKDGNPIRGTDSVRIVPQSD